MDDHKLRMLQSSVDCNWRTPPELFRALERTFHFDVDLAADPTNRLLLNYIGPGHPVRTRRDALTATWGEHGSRGFLNPPYSRTQYAAEVKRGVPREQVRWLCVEAWAQKAYSESLLGFTTVGLFPYAPQTQWFRIFVMGHRQGEIEDGRYPTVWRGHAALDYWRLPHRLTYLREDGTRAANANVNSCVIIWGPNPGFVGPWVPSGRYWSYR